jgi:hypothetical protein
MESSEMMTANYLVRACVCLSVNFIGSCWRSCACSYLVVFLRFSSLDKNGNSLAVATFIGFRFKEKLAFSYLLFHFNKLGPTRSH